MKIRIIVIGIIMLALLGGVYLPVQNVKATACSFGAVASVTTVAPGSTLDIFIRINTDTPARGAQFVLTWDPTKLTCTSAEKGNYISDFASAHNGSVFWFPDPPEIDNDVGRFPKNTSTVGSIAQSIITNGARNPTDNSLLGVTGEGTLYIIHMTAKSDASGTVNLQLSDVILVDATENSNDLQPTVNNTTVTISSSTTTTTPTATTPTTVTTPTTTTTPVLTTMPVSTTSPVTTTTPYSNSTTAVPSTSKTPSPTRSPSTTLKTVAISDSISEYSQSLDLVDAIDTSGAVISAITKEITYPNVGTVTLNIDDGTRVVNADGSPVTVISITMPSYIPDPPDGQQIIGIFDLKPENTVFTKPIVLMFKPDTSMGKIENLKQLSFAGYDLQKYEWSLSPTEIDSNDNSVSTTLSHFSMYAILARTDTGFLSSLNSQGNGWNWAILIVLCELLVGCLLILWLNRNKRPLTPAIATVAPGKVVNNFVKTPGNNRNISLGVSDNPNMNEISDRNIWDEILKESKTLRFQTRLEMIGGKLVLPRDDKSPDIELVNTGNNHMLIIMEYDPEMIPKGTTRIILRGSADEYEKSRENEK